MSWKLLSLVALAGCVVLWSLLVRARDELRRSPTAGASPVDSDNSTIVTDFLRTLEPYLRRIASIPSPDPEVASFLNSLRVDHGIRAVTEEVSAFSDHLLERYQLGEPLGEHRTVVVWERHWVMGDKLLFKGTLRAADRQATDAGRSTDNLSN